MEWTEEGHALLYLRAGLGFGTRVSADVSKVRLIPGRPRGPKSTTCFLREDGGGPRGRCEAKAEGGRG